MRISVIIPAWNLWSFTAACLESLACHTPPGSAQIIVVDNGSTDSTPACLGPFGKKLFGDAFKSVRLEQNRGFSTGCNAGAAAADTDMLFFLNNDTTATPNWLDPLLAVFENPNTGGAGPLLLYPDDTVQHCGIFFDPLLQVGHLYENFPADHPLAAKKRRLQAITGAALAVRRPLFETIGGFCEEYRNGYEDIDLCCQITRAGHNLHVQADSVFYHHTSKTPGRFDNEAHNATLASKHLAGMIRPDLHRFAYADGYELKLWDCGVFRPQLPPGPKADVLAKEASNSANIAAILQKEPLWRPGWQKLGENLAQEGKIDEAIDVALRSLRFFPDRSTVELAQKLAGHERSRKADALAQIGKQIMRVSPGHASNIALKLKKARKKALDEKDKLLGGYIDNWLPQLELLQAA